MSYEDNTIEMFIWGFQRHFQISVQRVAESLFHELDPNLKVKTFILGLVCEPSPGAHDVCLEPEDCGWLPSDFAAVREQAEHFLAIDGESNLMATNEGHMRSIQARRRARANESAVFSALDGHSWRTTDTRYFFSGFSVIERYDVGIVLTLSQFDSCSRYELPKVHADDRYQVPTSLIGAAAEIFLQKCTRALYVPNPALVDGLYDMQPAEVIRKAGNRLMEAPIFATRSIEGLYGLFDACNYIAALNYEGTGSAGGLIIADKDHPNVQFSIQLAKSVSLREYRTIRKLLEISSFGDSLLSDGAHLLGFGKLVGIYNQTDADLFQIRFLGHQKWEVMHAEHSLMRVNYGIPQLPSAPLRESHFLSTFEILFSDCPGTSAKRLYQLCCEACAQRHGTVIVMCPEAQNETGRLAGQATVINPILITLPIIGSVTAIDGAVILDLQGNCYAIGAILDGAATSKGNPGRGARFNSCVRYVEGLDIRGIPCLAVVVSEDGTAELIPDLPPRLHRSELNKREALIEELLSCEKWSLDKSFAIINWLDKHRFYLSGELCEKANAFMERHDDALRRQGAIRIMRARFCPNPKMAEAFLI